MENTPLKLNAQSIVKFIHIMHDLCLPLIRYKCTKTTVAPLNLM